MIHYNISLDQVDIYLAGELDTKVLRDLFVTIGEDSRFNCELLQFWHLGNADCSNLSSSGLFALAHEFNESVDSAYPRVAFIAATDLLYGMCRAYAAWIDSKPIEVGVFRKYNDALNWAYERDQSRGVA